MLKHIVIAALAMAAPTAYAADAACTTPANMLIMGGTPDTMVLSDAAKVDLRKYAADVPGVVASFGGVFKVRGRATAVLEGDWPTWKNVVVSEWPCLEAGQKFWHSEKYQKEMHPLRKASTVYDIALFKPAPKDPRATGIWTAEGGPGAKNIKCDAPIYFVVTSTMKDPAKLAAYRKGLGDSGIIYTYGATDVVRGEPAELLEGQWPKDFNATVTRWPCREAFDAFFSSAEYTTKYKPLKQGAADFTTILANEFKPKVP